MKTFKVGFSKPMGKIFPLFSWAIRLYEGTPYSHVYLRFMTRWETDMVYQASGSALNFMGQEAFEKSINPLEEYALSCSDEEWDKIMKYCTLKSGTGYGLVGAIGMAISKILRMKKNKFSDGEKSQYCVELISRILSAIKPEMNIDPEMTKLKDLNLIVRAMSKISI